MGGLVRNRRDDLEPRVGLLHFLERAQVIQVLVAASAVIEHDLAVPAGIRCADEGLDDGLDRSQPGAAGQAEDVTRRLRGCSGWSVSTAMSGPHRSIAVTVAIHHAGDS